MSVLCRFIRSRAHRLPIVNIARSIGGASTEYFAVTYEEHGDPMKVLEGKTLTFETDPSSLNSNEVYLRMLAAPINPADINMIQGVYPVKLTLPLIAGFDGIGEVLSVGSAVKSFQSGDWVVPNAVSRTRIGTWRTHTVCEEENLWKIPNDIPLLSAATLAVNPCTAYRMLTDFVDLGKGDVVIQNGSNSAVGQAVIQIAAAMGLQTVNIVRDRPNNEMIVKWLIDMGATHVITQEFAHSPEMKMLMGTMRQPKLALNCVGGKGIADILKYMERKSTMVTYGGMSKRPLMVPTGSFIFNDVRLRGFWMSQWNKEHVNSPERREMWHYLCGLVRKGRLFPPIYRTVPLEHFKDGIKRTMEPYTTQKQILVMDKSLL